MKYFVLTLINRSTPQSLDDIMPWLSDCYTKEDLGIDPSRCLAFLPSLSADSYKDLPVVPSPQSAKEDLPYKEKVKPPLVRLWSFIKIYKLTCTIICNCTVEVKGITMFLQLFVTSFYFILPFLILMHVIIFAG